MKLLETKLRNVEKTKVIMQNFSHDFWMVSIYDIDD